MNRADTYLHARHGFDECAAREEWRRLCFVLEGLQASSLVHDECDKYSVARTYEVYRDDHRTTTDRVERAIDRGDFQFFTDRGVPTPLLNSALARQMLHDWSAAVVSKLTCIEDMFCCHFGEELEEFLLTPAHAARLRAAASRDEANNVTLLERRPMGPEELVGCCI